MTARHYRIQLDGVLGSRFGGSFTGFDLEQGPNGTVLVGTCPDSSALFGVLDQVENLGLGLLTVESCPVDGSSRPSVRGRRRAQRGRAQQDGPGSDAATQEPDLLPGPF